MRRSLIAAMSAPLLLLMSSDIGADGEVTSGSTYGTDAEPMGPMNAKRRRAYEAAMAALEAERLQANLREDESPNREGESGSEVHPAP